MHTFDEIDTRRQRLGLTQKELCGKADVHESTYSRYCGRDAAGSPTPRILRKLDAAVREIAQERGIVFVDDKTGEVRQ
ncbi:helix-turn-helix transcriptional regulator [Rhizobium sp. ICMP 5592]|uniref:helix-turn-helix domain-containing protein n=1 Tax=Rhizobium sp. ICMP 5592 TaxID=2292445 RepID=UPI001295B09C|nr:helix-turn-helix transcriptional regulator [Rhizobium sp. ICMP 5592]MQB43362.1 XRE family transcriptional regulator [Rhizobium sp. ICMP 5592]